MPHLPGEQQLVELVEHVPIQKLSQTAMATVPRQRQALICMNSFKSILLLVLLTPPCSSMAPNGSEAVASSAKMIPGQQQI